MISMKKEDITNIKEEPGCYTIWVNKENLEKLLTPLEISFSELKNDIEEKNALYCIYVGEAINLRARIKNHLSAKNSTLIRSISVLLGQNKETLAKDNGFISEISIECYYRSELNMSRFEYEAKLINEKLRILNLASNEYPGSEKIIQKLSELRTQ